MKHPITISQGVAAIKINKNADSIANALTYSDFALTITESEGRTGIVTFGTDNWVDMDTDWDDQFQGLCWSLVGKGTVIRKQVEEARLRNIEAFGVVALWPVIAQAADTFGRIAENNALASVQLEVGCVAFGVFRCLSDPAIFALVEVFDSENSFGYHLETDHFLEFAEYARPQYIGNRSQTVKGTAHWT